MFERQSIIFPSFIEHHLRIYVIIACWSWAENVTIFVNILAMKNLSFLKILKWALIKTDWWKFTFTKIIFQVEFSMVMRYNLGYITVKGWWYNLAPFWITSLFTPKDFSILVLRFNSFNIAGLFPFPLEKWESLWFSK